MKRRTPRGTGSRSRFVEGLESRTFLSTTWYVDVNSPGSTHDGTTWDSAYLEIQQALASAAAGDEIRVADGEYISTTDSRINLKRDVSLVGGFAGSGAADPDARDPAELSSRITGSTSGQSVGLVIGVDVYAPTVFDGFSLDSNGFNGTSIFLNSATVLIRNCNFTGGMGIRSTNAAPTIENCVFKTIEGNGGGGITTSGEGSETIIVRITQCSFIDCFGNTGGAIRNQGRTLIVTGCTFTGNAAAHEGQVFYNSGASATFIDCNFTQNGFGFDPDRIIYNASASPMTFTRCSFIDNHSNSGAVITGGSGSLTLNECIFRQNSGSYLGGAVSVSGGSLAISGCTFEANTNYAYGGAVYSTGTDVRIANSIFSENSASAYGGGALYLVGGTATITSCSFNGNTVTDAGGSGGAIYSTTTLTLRDTTFSANHAENGGAVLVASGSLSAMECMFNENSAASGGAIHAGSGSGSPILTRCSFVGNTAQYGGAMYNSYNSPRITGCTFIRNRALMVDNLSRGGAIYGTGSSMTVVDCEFFGNSARDGSAVAEVAGTDSTYVNSVFVGNATLYSTGWGGAMWLYGGRIHVIQCTAASNQANRGGAIANLGGLLDLVNSILWGNSASTGPQYYGWAFNPGVFTNNDIQGDLSVGSHINVDPLFVRAPSRGADKLWGTADDDYGNLCLTLTSPCIDGGANSWVPVGLSTDLSSNPRFVDVPGVNDPGNIVDIGAYEYQTPLAVSDGAFAYNALHPTIALTFNGDVDGATLAVVDLTLFDPVTNLPIAALPSASVAYDAGTRTAKWSFSSPLADGNYRARIAAGSVADEQGYPLSADFTIDFFVLAGDANRDRVVDLSDLMILACNWSGTGKCFSQGDFNYDGIVNHMDLGVLAQKWQQKLDAPLPSTPAPPAAPKRSPVRAPTRIAEQVL